MEDCVGGFNQGNVVVNMAYGDIECHGQIWIVGEGVGYHGFHRGMVVIGLVLGELAYDEPFELWQYAFETKLIEDALYLVDWLGHVFDEEDGAGLYDVERSGDEVGYDGKVAAEQLAFSMPGMVEGMRLEGVGREIALKNAEEGVVILIARAEGYLLGHGRMDAGYAL